MTTTTTTVLWVWWQALEMLVLWHALIRGLVTVIWRAVLGFENEGVNRVALFILTICLLDVGKYPALVAIKSPRLRFSCIVNVTLSFIGERPWWVIFTIRSSKSIPIKIIDIVIIQVLGHLRRLFLIKLWLNHGWSWISKLFLWYDSALIPSRRLTLRCHSV